MPVFQYGKHPPNLKKSDMTVVTQPKVKPAAAMLHGPPERPDFPDWFRDQQHAAWQRFEALPMPTRKDQAWRFSTVGLLDLGPFKFSGEMSEDDRRNVLKYSCGLDEFAGRMIFAGDQLIERDIVSDQLKRRGDRKSTRLNSSHGYIS